MAGTKVQFGGFAPKLDLHSSVLEGVKVRAWEGAPEMHGIPEQSQALA